MFVYLGYPLNQPIFILEIYNDNCWDSYNICNEVIHDSQNTCKMYKWK